MIKILIIILVAFIAKKEMDHRKELKEEVEIKDSRIDKLEKIHKK